MRITCKGILTLLVILLMGGNNIVGAQHNTDRCFRFIYTNKDFTQASFADTMIMYSDSLISLLGENDKSPFLPYAIYYKGRALIIKQLFDSAKVYMHISIKLSTALSCDSIAAFAGKQMGWLYNEMGDADSSLIFLERALEIYKKNYDTLGIGQCYMTMTGAYLTKSDYAKALEFGLLSNKILRNQKSLLDYNRSFQNLGNVYVVLEQYDKALDIYHNCYETARQMSELDMAAEALTNIAVIHYQLKDYENNEKYLREAISYYEKSGNQKMLTKLNTNLSAFYYQLGKYKEAIESAKVALKWARQLNLKLDEVSVLINLGACYKKIEKYSEAENYYLEALPLAEENDFINELRILYQKLSYLYEEKGNYKLALEYQREHGYVKEYILNESNQKQIAELQAKYEYEENQAHILRLENEKIKNKSDTQKLRDERQKLRTRNYILIGSLGTLALVLFLIVRLYRVKGKKNKIINEQRIRQLEDEKKLLAARSILEGQEKERQRIARELHDGIGVLLSTASIHFSNLKEQDTDKTTLELAGTAYDFLQKAGTEVRRISHNMMPVVLQKFGLCAALEDLFDEVADSSTIEIHHSIAECPERFPEKFEVIIYRIVQEMLNNTLKHAEADRIDFNISISEKTIHIMYRDNGVGFDEKAAGQTRGLGLSGISSRVDYLNGKLHLQTSHGTGCEYRIDIPV